METSRLVKAAACRLADFPHITPNTDTRHLLAALENQGCNRESTPWIDEADMDSIEHSVVPRELPKRVNAKLRQFLSFPLLFASFLFPLPIPVPFLIGFHPGQFMLLHVICFGIPTVLAGVIVTLVLLRKRLMRTMKCGKLFQAIVTDVQETGWVAGNQRMFHATVEFQENGKQRKGVTNVYNTSVILANIYKNTGKPVRILVEPSNKNYIICLEMLPHGLD